MSTRPGPIVFYRNTGDADDAWVEAVGGEFQAEPDVEYEVCCVGPSAITTKTFSTSAVEYQTADGVYYATADGVIYGTAA